jgi:hypothetical protein
VSPAGSHSDLTVQYVRVSNRFNTIIEIFGVILRQSNLIGRLIIHVGRPMMDGADKPMKLIV